MKKIILMLAIIATTTIAFGQTKSNLSVNVGGSVLFPIGNSVDAYSPFYGETVKLVCQPKNIGYTLSATYLQDKNDNVQIPVMAGARIKLLNSLYFGTEAGVTFYNNNASEAFYNSKGANAKFTYSPSFTYQIKRVGITQNFLGSISQGKSTSSVGVGLTYKL